jgi:hypothetical protein
MRAAATDPGRSRDPLPCLSDSCDAAGADLAVWIVPPSLLLGDVTVALCARRSLVGLSQLLPALPAPPLTATHRQGHEQHHEHDGDGNNDDNDSRRYRCHGDQQGVTRFGSS